MIADRLFEADGSFHYPAAGAHQPGVRAVHLDGVRGDTVLVNGAPWPVAAVDGARHRLRILNASNARSYELGFDPPVSLDLIGSDGGLLDRPIELAKLVIAPGERYDVIVDFGRYPPGTAVTLVNGFDKDGPTGRIMRFDVGGRVADDSEVPPVLVPALDEPGDPAERRNFRFLAGQGGLPATINARTFRMDRADATPRLGTTEHWLVSGDPEHPIHVHLGQFRVLERSGGPPDPQDHGWKDTVLLRGGTVLLAVRFAGHRGRYVMHCHNLEHEDMMMMTNIEVI
ncbi:multicopper oxidase family protein [Actinoplanes couchii]|uniref:Bilirubin oxidase n=1 Tax=Actinoplanes couchii TaxID=403638 RepID=A0ABQ3XH59_9ACTN|nr:multicopper oxidase domain-containing protein [Actinoplanes couchii]MDR6320765.1 FtsP/CotA-like multicopper oxidase with cupredoxin domain [Actinoplanes couchii]GID57750.1 hypothetical protein Aco03nite_061540 [Actinoplanes couchii]